MLGAASLRKKERLFPFPYMHTASIWGERKFCQAWEFFKNAPYKQKIIFHLASNDKMSQKFFFLLGRWISGTGLLILQMFQDNAILNFTVIFKKNCQGVVSVFELLIGDQAHFCLPYSHTNYFLRKFSYYLHSPAGVFEMEKKSSKVFQAATRTAQ